MSLVVLRCRLSLVRLDRPAEARPALERALGLLDASPHASTAANLRQSIRQLQAQCEEEMTGALAAPSSSRHSRLAR